MVSTMYRLGVLRIETPTGYVQSCHNLAALQSTNLSTVHEVIGTVAVASPILLRTVSACSRTYRGLGNKGLGDP